MKSRLALAIAGILAVAAALAPTVLRTQHAAAELRGLSLAGMNRVQRRLLSGFASLEATGAGSPGATGAAGTSGTSGAPPVAPRVAPSGSSGVKLCPSNIKNTTVVDVLVNQNCLNVSDPDVQGRGQAEDEAAIAENPARPTQIVAGLNDFRQGDGNCSGAFSSDGGQTWTDTTVPDGFTSGAAFGGEAREYWQTGGDPSVAWDSRGNAYLACQVFQRGMPASNNPDQSSAVYVFRSSRDGGASWDFPGRPAVEASTTSGVPFNDRPYLTVDHFAASSFRDRIYVTWTLFAADGTAYIYEVHSNDYGQSFSSPVVASTTSALCTNTLGVPTPSGTCNENQYSDPFVGPDGTLYVAYANFNNSLTGSDNRNQILLTRSTDGGQTFSSPVKVSDYYELPDCATYQASQDAGRACVPEKGSAQNSVFRASNYPSGAVNPLNASQVVVTVGSYINADSNETNGCTPAGFGTDGINLYSGVKTSGACNNKILVSVSTNGGATFTGSSTDPRSLPVASPLSRQALKDQWFPWASYTPTGAFAVSYYDRGYGTDETTGAMDVSLSTSTNLSTFAVTRATTTSMPLPTQFTDAQGNGLFLGDYDGLSAVTGAHPAWTDTRNPDAFLCPGTAAPGVPPALCTGTEPNGLRANDQSIYTAKLATP